MTDHNPAAPLSVDNANGVEIDCTQIPDCWHSAGALEDWAPPGGARLLANAVRTCWHQAHALKAEVLRLRAQLAEAEPKAPSEPEPTYDYICDNCGSNDCGHDASAKWDVTCQVFDLCTTYDNTFCDACGLDDPGIHRIQIDPAPKARELVQLDAFNVAICYFPAIINGDYSGLEDDDGRQLEQWLAGLEQAYRDNGPLTFVCGGEDTAEDFAEDAVTGLRANTEQLQVWGYQDE